jgi:hypothetical protein
MQIKTIASLLLVVTACSSNAATISQQPLQEKRELAIKQYVLDLQTANYKDINNLFEKNGIVVSTSKGRVGAKEFFYAFLPNIVKGNSELHQMYVSQSEVNRMVARFHFGFTLKDGESENGEYVDEFIFSDNSDKLAGVYMFENMKF